MHGIVANQWIDPATGNGAAFLGALELGFRAAGWFDPTELHDPYLGFRGTAPLYRPETGAEGEAIRRTSPNKRRAYRDVATRAEAEQLSLRKTAFKVAIERVVDASRTRGYID